METRVISRCSLTHTSMARGYGGTRLGRRAAVHCAGSARPLAVAQADFLPELLTWTRSRGGWIHPSLVVSSDTVSGARGLVTSTRIDAKTDYGGGEGVVLRLPFDAYISAEDVSDKLVDMLGSRRKANVDSLSALRRISLFLAAERKLGAQSLWAPYLASLPPDAPNGWAMGSLDLSDALKRYETVPGGTGAWRGRVEGATASIAATSAALAEAFGGPLGGLKGDDVSWGMGMCLSRCFGEEPHLALGPVVDLLNHDTKPNCQVRQQADATEQEGGGSEVRLVVDALEAGQEVTISYVGGNDPMAAFLNFGFVPDE